MSGRRRPPPPGFSVLIGALLSSGCTVVSGTAAIATVGANVAVGTARAGGRLAYSTVSTTGRVITHHRDGRCTFTDARGKQSRAQCPPSS